MATVVLFRTGLVPKLRGCAIQHSPILHVGRGFRTTPRCRDVKKDDVTKTEAILGVPYNTLAIGVPKESFTGERRVSVTPAVTAALVKKGFNINVESGAGVLANFRDAGNWILKHHYNSPILSKICRRGINLALFVRLLFNSIKISKCSLNGKFSFLTFLIWNKLCKIICFLFQTTRVLEPKLLTRRQPSSRTSFSRSALQPPTKLDCSAIRFERFYSLECFSF